MSEKIDRRIQRTKNLLREAILALVVEVGYENLTVEQITEYANLGRTTFYLHYKDKYDLLIDSLNQVQNTLFAEIYAPENLEKWRKEGIDPRKRIFSHAAENASMYKLLFTDQVSGVVFSKFRQHLALRLESIIQSIQEHRQITPPIPNPVSSSYVSGALLGLLIWWLENDMPYSPEEVWEMYHTLMRDGTVKGIGIP